MPRLLTSACRSIVLALMLAVTAPALAQDNNPDTVRLGVIDMKLIIQQSNALATIRQALDEENLKFQELISEEEVQLRLAERELNLIKDELTPAEFQQRLSVFEEKVVAIQQSIQSQKNSFDRSIQQLQTQLQQELLRIVSSIATERKLSMVFQRQNVVIYNNALDVTDEALARLNERTKNITVTKLPEN